MDPCSTATPQQDNKLEQAEKTVSRFSKEALQNNLQEISRETEEITQCLPSELSLRNVKKEIEQLDKKQKKWLWLYVIWLLWEMKTLFLLFAPLVVPREPLPDEIADDPLLNEMEEVMKPFILPGLIIGLIWEVGMTSPFWMQLWAIKEKNLKRTNKAMKIMRIFMYFNIIPFAFMCIGAAFYDVRKEQIQSGKFFYPMDPSMKEAMLNLEKSELIVEILKFVAGVGISWLLSYGGGVKFRNYLTKREELMGSKEKEE